MLSPTIACPDVTPIFIASTGQPAAAAAPDVLLAGAAAPALVVKMTPA